MMSTPNALSILSSFIYVLLTIYISVYVFAYLCAGFASCADTEKLILIIKIDEEDITNRANGSRCNDCSRGWRST